MKLVGAANFGPGVLAHLRDRLRIELADILGRLQVHQRLGADRLGASLFGRAAVEEGVGAGVKNGVRQRRR